jgi:hypothetical protein
MIAAGFRCVMMEIQIGMRYPAAGSDVERFAFPRSGALARRAISIIVKDVSRPLGVLTDQRV